MSLRCAVLLEQRFDMPDSLRGKQGVGTHVANFRRNIIEDQHVTVMFDRVHNGPLCVFARTTLDTAFHLCAPRSKGVGHFGGCGSYTVII